MLDDGDTTGLPKQWGRARAAHPSYTDFYRRSGYSGFEHEARSAGSLGVQLLHVLQDGHGLTDRATPDLLIGIRRRVARAPARYNLGDGWINIPTDRPHTVAAPPLTDVDYQIDGPSELIILAAPAQRLASAIESPALVERLAPVYERPFQDPMFPLLAGRAWTEAERADGLFVDSVALALLSALLSAADAHRSEGMTPAPPTDLRFTRVIDFIEAHLHQEITLTDLAAVACLSPFHFTRAFRARHGVSPVRFVQRRRIERSMRLLLQPGSRIAAVAHACGFADQAHFTTAFRRVTGSTPGAWRAARTAGQQSQTKLPHPGKRRTCPAGRRCRGWRHSRPAASTPHRGAPKGLHRETNCHRHGSGRSGRRGQLSRRRIRGSRQRSQRAAGPG